MEDVCAKVKIEFNPKGPLLLFVSKMVPKDYNGNSKHLIVFFI